MQLDDRRRRIGTLVAASLALAATLCAIEGAWPLEAPMAALEGLSTATAVPAASHPLRDLGGMVVAALVGLLITAVQRATRDDRRPLRSMEHAQVLLAVSGALMMIIIDNSLARAFGIAGAASIVRFRTPVEDPRDVTVLFLLMGLGMAAGLGAIGLAGLGAAFLAVCLVVLGNQGEVEATDREMKVALVAAGPEFPSTYVRDVFAVRGIALEPIELTRGEAATMRYRARLPREQSIEELSAQLLNGGKTGLKSVAWESGKRGQL